jgi:hypothetical protein
MSRFLLQRSVDRISAYANDLEELADEMERSARCLTRKNHRCPVIA